jgi:poly-gamma-glutamate synthesis protein (capsule biosynthesis protein)
MRGHGGIRMNNDVNNTSNITKKPDAKPTEASSTMLFTGNIYWGRAIDAAAKKSEQKEAYPFSRLNEFHKDDYQAWIAGLECPTVPGVTPTVYEEETLLKFNCSAEYLPEAAKWFDVVTLANNHTDNQGIEGFAATQAELEKNKIQYFGHYDPRVLDEICEVITVKTKVRYDNNTTKDASLPVAMCGYHGVFRIPSEEALAVMEAYSKVMPVIALPHMGAEYEPVSDQLRTSLYRSMIDHGADMVLGDHPHWVQNTEAYKGKLIVYSMGNFMFDQQFNAEVMRSAAIKVVMTAKGSAEQLDAWAKLAPTCQAYHDDCLAKIDAEHLQPLDTSFAFDVIGTGNKGLLTHPADEASQQSILDRMNWATTVRGLQPPQSAVQ